MLTQHLGRPHARRLTFSFQKRVFTLFQQCLNTLTVPTPPTTFQGKRKRVWVESDWDTQGIHPSPLPCPLRATPSTSVKSDSALFNGETRPFSAGNVNRSGLKRFVLASLIAFSRRRLVVPTLLSKEVNTTFLRYPEYDAQNRR